MQALPNLFVQAEFEERRSDRGDLSLNFEPDNFDPGLRVRTETTSPRFGLRLETSPRSTLLLAGRWGERSERNSRPSGGDSDFVISQDTDGHEEFVRFTYHGARASHSVGVDAYDLDFGTRIELAPCEGEPCVLGDSGTESAYASYFYRLDLQTRPELQWTLGLSYSMLDDDFLMVSDRTFGPKLGVRWKPADAHESRLILSRGAKRYNSADLTLEPTVIAGFNQLYDDNTGTLYTNAGIAHDWNIGSRMQTGAGAPAPRARGSAPLRGRRRPGARLARRVADRDDGSRLLDPYPELLVGARALAPS